MKKQIPIKILTLIGVILLTSCDKRQEAIERFNTPPQVVFRNGYNQPIGTTITDSLKLTQDNQLNATNQLNPNNRNTKSITLKYDNKNRNIASVGFTSSSKNAKLYYQGRIMADILPIDRSELALTFENNSEELTTLEFSVTDKLHSISKVVYKIFSFVNLAPIASLDYHHLQTTSKFEYELDASKSFDEDRNQGGGIDWYIFHIDAREIRTRSSRIRYVFNNNGTFPIDLVVIDNQGKSSKVVSKSITINKDGQ